MRCDAFDAGAESDSVVVVAGNSTESLRLEDGVEIDQELVSRSPLLRTLAPVLRFFRSRAGESVLILQFTETTNPVESVPSLELFVDMHRWAALFVPTHASLSYVCGPLLS